jgi:hypothetical protein
MESSVISHQQNASPMTGEDTRLGIPHMNPPFRAVTIRDAQRLASDFLDRAVQQSREPEIQAGTRSS